MMPEGESKIRIQKIRETPVMGSPVMIPECK